MNYQDTYGKSEGSPGSFNIGPKDKGTKYSKELRDLKVELQKLERDDGERNQVIALRQKIKNFKQAEKNYNRTRGLKGIGTQAKDIFRR
tara:strand:+ start:155 stop:421 length:267 start_codon:yes stop_codon:yes gene_type:complete